jgi:hypothetical protein
MCYTYITYDELIGFLEASAGAIASGSLLPYMALAIPERILCGEGHDAV